MIELLIDFIRTLTDAEKLRQLLTTVFTGWYGYAMLFGIVFAETGLLVGFFLPGDSLLFTVGMVCGAGGLNIWWINFILIAAAIIGDTVGYHLGRRTGKAIFDRPDSRFFKREYVTRTHEFYEKYGGRTIIYARFVPIIRTFAPFIAGVGEMSYGQFIRYNVFGGIGWVLAMTTLGYWLGGVGIIRRHLEKVIIGIIVVSVLPIVFELYKKWRESRATSAIGTSR